MISFIPPRRLTVLLLATALVVADQGRSLAQSGGRGLSAQGPGAGGPVGRSGGGSLLGGDGQRKSYGVGLSEAATDEIVTAIRVEGNKTIPAGRITSEMQTRVGRNFDPRALTADVRKLASLPWFVDVKPLSEKTPEGRVIILRVVERPLVRYVEYLGNSKLRDKRLAEETNLSVGSAVDPYAVEEARRRLQELYLSQGFARAQVSVLEGNKSTDPGVVFVINEGVRQKIRSVTFEGNNPEFATARRLKTKVQSKPGALYGLFGKGRLNRETLEADVQLLTDYYREFGFYLARVSRVLEFDESGEWADIRFVINEGPRYYVRNLQFLGNKKFSESSLRLGLKLLEEQPFERTRLLVDTDWIKQLYGSQGHVFADVRAEPILLEEPGKVDIVYHIDEGEAWRVGRIFVNIGGENPHTRIQTALNRLSLKPGQIMDIRELRASERRLQASQLYLTDPARGVAPKITFRIPELNDTDFTASGGGSPSGSGFRGQSPEPEQAFGWRLRAIGDRLRRDPPRAGKGVDVHVVVGAGDDKQTFEAYRPPAAPRRHTAMKPPSDAWPQQADPQGGRRRPDAYVSSGWQTSYGAVAPGAAARRVTVSRPEFRGQSPPQAPTANGFVPPVTPASPPSVYATAPAYNAGQASYGGTAAAGGQQPVAQAGFASPVGSPPGQVQPVQFSAEGGFPAPTTSPGAPAPRVIGAPYTNPNVDPSVLPIPPNGQLFPGGQFGPVGPVYPDRAVDLFINVQEGQTGRFTVGVGVNSDAGVVGNIVLDERNFDIRRVPRSFRDFANGTAFRGAGQRFRLEAAPGSQVQRYLVSFQEPYLFDTPISLSVSGSLFDRRFEDYDTQRLGGRIALGYQWVENDVSASVTYRGENVNVSDAAVPLGAVPELDQVLGDNSLHGLGVRIANDTRNNPFLATQGHYVELTLEQVVGSFDYPRAILDARKYFLLSERPDHSGRHVLSVSTRLGFTGSNTPLYDNFFAGGFSTLRGFDFQGASPVVTTAGPDVEVGGEFMWINSVEYLFPITADDTVSGVVFCDFGTVERNVTIEDFRVAPGVGLRLQVPALGPAPIALDFAFAVNEADTDDTQVFTFNVGFLR